MGRSMIGGRMIKYLKAKKKPKRAIHEEYATRNARLPYLGYGSYREYLASEEWKALKRELLAHEPRCLICQRKASVVHHLSYDDRTMIGLDLGRLACLCHPCHGSIEVTPDGRKRTLAGANAELLALAERSGRGDWAAHVRRLLAARPRDAGTGEVKLAKRKGRTLKERAQKKKWKGVWRKADGRNDR